MKKNLLLSLTLPAVILMGCHNQQASSVKSSNNSGIIETKAGETFMIKLESNPTTGYSWRLAELKSGIVEKISNVYKQTATEERLVGSGGIEEWTFKALAKGKVTITFEYVRPWEKDVRPVKTATYLVTVK